jgi:hypothetical protein
VLLVEELALYEQTCFVPLSIKKGFPPSSQTENPCEKITKINTSK